MPEEGIYNINLGRLYWTGRRRRAARAIKKVRDFLRRHSKAQHIIIDESINEYIYSGSYDRPPRKISVRIIPVDEEGKIIKATLAIPIKRLETLKEEGKG